MKTEIQYVYTIAATAVAMLFVPLSGRADPPADLVRLSEELEIIVDRLNSEFGEHYGRSRAYQSLIGYLNGIEARGDNVHRLAKNRGVSAPVIQQELAVISQLNSNMRVLVNQLENEAGRYVLRVFGDTRDVHIVLGSLSRNIQGMQRAASSYGVGTGYSRRFTQQYSYQQRYYNTNRQPYGSNYNQPAYSYPNRQQPHGQNYNRPAYSYPNQPHRNNPPPTVQHRATNPLQKLQQTRARIKSAIFGRH